MTRLGIICAVLVAALACAASATARSGSPDPTFGEGGRVLLNERPQQAVRLPDGRVVIAHSGGIAALLPSGEIDPGFGEAGTARIHWPESERGIYVPSLTVDPLGRIVVLGNGRVAASPGPGAFSSRVAIARLTPDGRPDPSFGGDGFLVTEFAEFGLPAPVPGPFGEPEVWGQGLATDAQGRIVVTGTRSDGPSCQMNKGGLAYTDREAFVARLLGNGDPDVSFGSAGMIAMETIDALGQPMPDLYDGLYLPAYNSSGCAGTSPGRWLVRLLPLGAPDEGFGSEGWRISPRGGSEEMRPATLDRQGRVLLTGYDWGSRQAGIPNRVIVKRLGRNGSLDASFGRKGTARVPGALPGPELLAVDADGGILVAANLGRKASHERPSRPGILLARLRPDGALDRRFGRDGIVRIRLGGDRRLFPRSLLVPEPDQVLVAGEWRDPGPRSPSHGTALFRFVLGDS